MPEEHKSNNPRGRRRYTKGKKRVGFFASLKHIRRRGLIVMIIFLAIYAMVFRVPGEYSYLDRLLGKDAIHVMHSTISKEDASKLTVLIDAGHGGFDNGASSKYVKAMESELNLSVAMKLKDELENFGFKVVMTRTDENALGDNKDADMAKRKEIIYDSKADIMVSVHMNTHQDSSVNGPIVFHMPGSDKGNKLASLVQTSMNAELNPKNPKNVQAQNFLVLRSGNMPGILVECGFMTNKSEGKKLGMEYYQKDVAKSISLGIVDYFAKSA